ncbi:hypothetical protein SUGI_0345110 [Cryptomeria japonica]|nr:hypothetical protein SUGI_0345110 [Cryptomeria japonica]
MPRNSPIYSPPRRCYGGRERGGYNDGYSRSTRETGTSLLIRNLPLDCRPDELRIPFERFGPIRDIYLPRDYYSGEPRGFGFVEFRSSYDAAEAQYYMDGQLLGGRVLITVFAKDNRKRPEEMRMRAM